MNQPERCPHFQTRIEKLPYELTIALLPVRRCLLAERMVALIRPKPDSQEVVRTLVVDPGEEVPHCLYGPDLDVIEHSKCTRARCEESCSPAYVEILSGFKVEDALDPDCQEAVPSPDPAQTPSS